MLTDCRLEASLDGFDAGSSVQFERIGYFRRDESGAWNRTVGLRDTWAKLNR